MSDERWLDAAAVALFPFHYHVEEDNWYCCGACDAAGREPECCSNDERRGTCDCGLAEKREKAKRELLAAFAAGQRSASPPAPPAPPQPPAIDELFAFCATHIREQIVAGKVQDWRPAVRAYFATAAAPTEEK